MEEMEQSGESGEKEGGGDGDREGGEEINSGDDEEGEKAINADGSSLLTKYQSVLQLSRSVSSTPHTFVAECLELEADMSAATAELLHEEERLKYELVGPTNNFPDDTDP